MALGEEVVALATEAGNSVDADFFQTLSEMLLQFHGEGRALSRVAGVLGYPVGMTDDGTLVVPVYCDYAAWTEEAEMFVWGIKETAARDLAPKRFVMPVSGVLSQRALTEIEGLGFEVTQGYLAEERGEGFRKIK